MEANLN